MTAPSKLCTRTGFVALALTLIAAPTATRWQAIHAAINARLAAEGAGHRLAAVELASWRSVVNKPVKTPKLDFVPADPRRQERVDLTWAVDTVDLTSGVPPAAALGAIADALLPFLSERCADGLVLTPVTPAETVDLGDLERQLLGLPTSPRVADLTHAGWMPAAFFDHFSIHGSTSILAVTASFVFVDANGHPTDVDGNGALDVSHRETYYNDSFDWSTVGLGVDVGTVALHETAHLFGLDEVAATLAPGSDPELLEPHPADVYAGPEQQLPARMRASFCANWRHWPDR